MFKLSSTPLEQINLREGFASDAAGAFASFEGRVRDHNNGKQVSFLEYEATETLAHTEAAKIFDEAREKFALVDARAYHRIGRLQVGEMAVWVGCLAAHRVEAFKACRYIIDEIKKKLPIWKKEFYADGSSNWVSAQAPEDTESSLGGDDYYARQVNLPEVGEEGQRKLKDAKVLVVGAGGLGCPALMSLTGAGVGTIGICEHDKIELSNLHRQFLYSFDDIGQPKARVAKNKINALNPTVQVNVHDHALSVDNVESIIESYGIVLDCTDDMITKYILNDACYLFHKTLVQAGLFQWEGQLRVMLPSQKGCLRCLWPNIPHPGCVGTCVDGGVLGVIPNIFGHLQAMEAIRIILHMQKVFDNELLILNVADFNIRRLKINPDEGCPLCGSRPIINDINAQNYEPQAEYLVDCAALEPDSWTEFELIDIREAQERQDDPVPEIKSRHIPMNQLMEDQSPIEKGKNKYLLFCTKGLRSSRLAQMLREMGYENVYSVKDGIEAIRDRLKTNVKG